MSVIAIRAAEKTYPSGVRALLPVELTVAAGEFVTLLGPSGCGKSTLLNMVAGLLAPSAGQVQVGEGERVSFVFQEATLMPWARVAANVRLPLDLAGTARDAGDRRVSEALQLVGLDKFANAWPRELSGGMQMRASIARSLVTEPTLLLMDEPFGALDALTRGTIQDELMGIVRETQQTVFMITHDVDEAILLADRILLMSNGSEGPGGYVPGGIAETVTNALPRSRNRASLHHLPGYYEMRNHIVDFLVSRAKAGGAH